jgi:hypothetical protein
MTCARVPKQDIEPAEHAARDGKQAGKKQQGI